MTTKPRTPPGAGKLFGVYRIDWRNKWCGKTELGNSEEISVSQCGKGKTFILSNEF